MSRLLVILLLFSVLAEPARAEEGDCTVFHDLTIQTPEGPMEGWSLVVEGHQIAAVGKAPRGLSVQNEIAQWKGRTCQLTSHPSGSILTAGLVQVGTQVGLVEVSLEDRTRHHDAGGEPVRAAHSVADSYDPLSPLIPIARRGGITSAVIVPTGGIVSGQAAWVDLAGRTQAEAIQERSVAFPAALGSGSPAAGLGRLAGLLDDARAFARDRRAYDQNRTRSLDASRRDLEALQPVLRGEAPLILRADRAAQIEAILRFAQREKIEVILRGGAEAWMHAEGLAKAGIAVIIDPLVTGAGSFDQRAARADSAAILAEAGVAVLMSNHSAHFARNLRQLAGNAVRAGMDHDQAMQAITQTPAEVFGLEQSGRLEPGKRANIVLWSGDPLEISTRPILVLIGGRTQSLESRQTRLRDRYRTLPGTPLLGPPIPRALD
ncbi:MAG: amidohydrolase family protein [Myxococcota bacterium]|nr:amidohydrolase family protein [Myxococcota bacterium]